MYVRIFFKNNKIESTRKIKSEQSTLVNHRIIVGRTARNYHSIHEVLFKGFIIYVIVVYFLLLYIMDIDPWHCAASLFPWSIILKLKI